MPKPHPIELRKRVVAHVEEGFTHRSTAIHFKVSPKFVNDMVKLKKDTGSLEARPIGNNKNHGKIAKYTAYIEAILAETSDLTLMELSAKLEAEKGVSIHYSTISRLLAKLGLTHKKRQFMPKNNTDPI